ncbi:MAG: 23S rRNA (uracil(1939)-C(5))-methyltransferase RlmD [Clostridia bacterium]|nr:23S rRNA (uracil(1939)-C(5))-methyltransferase RlmD [Clostridia bacterium]
MSLRKNDIIELDITGFSSEGSGVGRYDGQAVFVAGAAEGDCVQCVIIKAKKNYAIGKIQHILKASPDRIIPDCPVFPRCGGCQYRHISYEAEIRIKTQKVRDAFFRIGHLDAVPVEAVGAENPDRYRNKAQYPVETQNGRLLTGFYAPFSHRVIDCKNCLLQPAEFSDILKVVAKWSEKYKIPSYDEKTHKGLIRHIYIRKGFETGEIMVCLVINGDKIFKKDELISALIKANKNIKTVLLNHNTEDTNVIMGKKETVLYGKGYIEDILCSKRFKISPLSFYQVNHDQAQRLYEKAAEFAIGENTKTLIDLYCGAGTIGLTMAHKVEKLIGVEIVPEAIEDAKINAELNGITNARFICADASAAAKTLKDEGITPDTIILDPPRKGCDEELLGTVCEMSPERIVYVSCDPATLARDLAKLEDKGYKTQKAVPYDLFPRTVHIECCVLLCRTQQ